MWTSYSSAESRLAKILFRVHLKRSIPPMSRRRKYRLCSVFTASRVGRTTTIYPQSIAMSKPDQKNRALRHGLSEAGRLPSLLVRALAKTSFLLKNLKHERSLSAPKASCNASPASARRKPTSRYAAKAVSNANP